MGEFKGTKGKCRVDVNVSSQNIETRNIVTINGGKSICTIVRFNPYEVPIEIQEANAELILDAFNTVTECDLMPSELLNQRNELLEVLIEIVRISDRNNIAWNRAKEVIKKATEL